MARQSLAARVYARMETDQDEPFIIANTTLEGMADGVEVGETVTVAEYRLVRKFKVHFGLTEVK